jgi:hypothetical protein
VIYTLGLLLLARPRIPLSLMVIPLAWALIGASAVWLLGIPEDASLLAAAALALVVLFRNRRQSGR